ncbi:MAG: transposase [Flavobacteriales bacterium]|nr:transposase [Flavobacteriales bacterium]
MDRAIQKIFRASFDNYRAKRNVPLDHLRAAESFMQCRTSALGGHIQSCKNRCEHHVQYHSCKHRSCPQCNFTATARWLEKQKKRVLHCPHHHVIFTLPHEFNDLWRFNKSRLMQLLFTVAKEVLFELLRDNKYLGADPGVIATFHSWGRNLIVHPHLHCLVTAGGLSSNGEWLEPKKSFLLPGGVVRDLFSGKYLANLKKLLVKGELDFPPGESMQRYLNCCNKLGRKKWNVRIEKRYVHPNGVINYLSRYVRGGPFKNQQIKRVTNDVVEFHYFDHREKKQASSNFSPERFVASALEHVPPHRKQVIRYWGLYSGRRLASRNEARVILGQALEESDDEFLDWQGCLEKIGVKDQGCCKICHEPLKVVMDLPRPRSRDP